MLDTHHIEALEALLEPKSVVTNPDELVPHLSEWREKFFGSTDVMLAPASTDDTQKAIKYCAEHNIKVVPQGGNTGLVGGSLPGLGPHEEILISSKRMNQILKVDAANLSITAEAGCTVAALQQAAAEKGLLFPLSLASEGSCTVGGIISTNAGGVHVLRYGTTRALTLGIEAVLPSGKLYEGLGALRKDNTGYALDQLLIGAEGTLGIVTKATFKLAPAEIEKHTLWLAVDSPAAAVALLSDARIRMGEYISVFEIMPHMGLEFVLAHIPNVRNPLASAAPWYILMEVAASSAGTGLEPTLNNWLEGVLSTGMITDGVVAKSAGQAQNLWQLRETMSEAQKHEGGSIKHDISVPVSAIPAFIDETTSLLEKAFPGCRVTPFGHVGDGNLHFNVMQPHNAERSENDAKEAFLSCWEDMNILVHDQVIKFGGSISAEHGIGSLKKHELARSKPASEIAAMQLIKKALDPKNIMNPNVLFTHAE